jgi:hypothetical protein
MRILYEGDYEATEQIPSEDIHDIQLVALPSKAVVAHLLTKEANDSPFDVKDITLLWSPDSKWCAFYYETPPRAGYTTVFRLAGGKFIAANKPEDLITAKAGTMARTHDVRCEYIRPLRWTKSGTLFLWQSTLRRVEDSSDWELTAAFDGKRKFRVVGARLLSPEEAKKLEAEADKVRNPK